MKKNFKIIVYFLIINFLYSCGGMSDAGKVLRNEKINNSDEFLVKKKDPLILPPDYNTLPKPGTIQETQKSDENKIEKILNVSEENSNKKNKSSSVEQSIINEINR